MMGESQDRAQDRVSPMEEAHRLIQRLRELADAAENATASPELKAKERQLAAVGKSVAQLEREGVDVPDELRSLKADLASELAEFEQSQRVVQYLRAELPSIVGALGGADQKRRPTPKREHEGHQTPGPTLGAWLLEALGSLGGSASPSAVREWIEQHHGGEFLPGDRERYANSQVTWRARVNMERVKLVKRGKLKSDSPSGVWELAHSE